MHVVQAHALVWAWQSSISLSPCIYDCMCVWLNIAKEIPCRVAFTSAIQRGSELVLCNDTDVFVCMVEYYCVQQ